MEIFFFIVLVYLIAALVILIKNMPNYKENSYWEHPEHKARYVNYQEEIDDGKNTR